MKSCFCLLTFALLLGISVTLRADDKVIVHEWGTFTSLLDENGQAIGGINVDDEPVPMFVLGASYVRNFAGKEPVLRGFGLPIYSRYDKGWMPADHEVTMRLETPVLYFYPPKGQTPQSVPPLDVHVDFHGGILSQYYPYAEPSGWSFNFPIFTQHIGDIVSSLDWKQVRLGSAEKPVETDDKVWTTPREVAAPMLEVNAKIFDNSPSGFTTVPQAEHFLFYRGIGHLDSPLRLNQTSLDPEKRRDIFPWVHHILAASPSLAPPAQGSLSAEAWLADIQSDGSCRWEYLPIAFGPSGVYVAGKFSSSDFRPANLAKLKASMHDALVKEGLYDDEATAMLKTWELSYFKSPGLRFFYIVPHAWVDQVLPLKITGAPTEITRVMIGRIELISDAQQATLAKLAAGPCPDILAIQQAAIDALQKSNLSETEKAAFYRDERPLSDLGITIPPLVQDYLNLGRFRDALIVHEQQQHPSPALAQFIKANRLAPQEN